MTLDANERLNNFAWTGGHGDIYPIFFSQTGLSNRLLGVSRTAIGGVAGT